MADLLPVSLVEMLAEMRRDLLARKRTYANRTFTRRLTHERAERRLAVIGAIIENLEAQLTPGEMAEIAKQEKKRQDRKRVVTKTNQPAKIM